VGHDVRRASHSEAKGEGPVKKKWVMPKWMEAYRESLTYGNRAEELLSGPRATIQVNAPLAFIQADIESQVTLLTRLHDSQLLAATPKRKGKRT
jgi:hypothetical protein